MIILWVTFFPFALLIIFWRYLYKKHQYWKSQGIDGPPPGIVGNFYDVADVNKPRYLVLNEWTQKYGQTYGYYEGVVPVLVTSNLDILHDVFIGKFDKFYARKLTNMLHGDMEDVQQEPRVNLFVARGQRWHKLRQLISPAFTVAQLVELHSTIEDSVFEMTRRMEYHSNGDSFNIHSYYQELTYDVISRLAMGQIGTKQFENEGVDIVKAILMRTHRVLPWYLASTFPQFEYQIRNIFYKHKNVRGGDMEKLINICVLSVGARIKSRLTTLAHGEEPEQIDFIDMFLAKFDDELKVNKAVVQRVAEDVIGSCFVLLLAGFDTTANALGCATHLLAQHPEVMRRAQNEIDEHCTDANISYEQVGRLRYLDAVVKEALRLHPVAWFACSRECVETTTLGDIVIEKGVRVEADVKAIHLSEEIWGPDAKDFVPERFLNNENRHPLAWLAFGAGRRQCVGMRMGMVEAKLALAHILRKWSFVSGNNFEKELKFKGCTTTSPESVTVHLRLREL